jgi:hypothetical protein
MQIKLNNAPLFVVSVVIAIAVLGVSNTVLSQVGQGKKIAVEIAMDNCPVYAIPDRSQNQIIYTTCERSRNPC